MDHLRSVNDYRMQAPRSQSLFERDGPNGLERDPRRTRVRTRTLKALNSLMKTVRVKIVIVTVVWTLQPATRNADTAENVHVAVLANVLSELDGVVFSERQKFAQKWAPVSWINT